MASRRIQAASSEPSVKSSREKPGRGRARLCVWPELHIGTVIKRTQKKRVVEVTRTMSYGSQEEAERLLQQSKGGNVLNTAFMAMLECHHASAACHLDAQMSSERSPPASTGDGNVPAWHDL